MVITRMQLITKSRGQRIVKKECCPMMMVGAGKDCTESNGMSFQSKMKDLHWVMSRIMGWVNDYLMVKILQQTLWDTSFGSLH